MTGVQWLIAVGVATILGIAGTGAIAYWILVG